MMTLALFSANPSLLDDIKKRYGEASRHYHNWSHIEQMLGEFETIKDRLNHPDAVLYAIYYHDAIYNIPGDTNEEESAALFAVEAVPHIDGAQIELAQAYIVATKSHILPDNLTESEYTDGQYFLDIDMSILGAQRNVYLQYASNVRQEYAMFNDEMYNFGRAKVLNEFLDRDRIFLTDHYNDKLEQAARENIANEMAPLESGAVA